MADDKKAFLLRIDAEVWREIEAWARDELRSANGQAEWILRQAITRRKKGIPERPAPGSK